MKPVFPLFALLLLLLLSGCSLLPWQVTLRSHDKDIVGLVLLHPDTADTELCTRRPAQREFQCQTIPHSFTWTKVDPGAAPEPVLIDRLP